MKFLHVFLLSVLFLGGCCHQAVRDQGTRSADEAAQQTGQQPSQPQAPASIQQNQSTVDAEVVDVKVNSKYDFTVKLKVAKIYPNDFDNNIAVQGEVYELKPEFYYDEEKQIPDNPHNLNLLQLQKAKPGDILKAIIYLDGQNGWLINEIIK